MALPAGRYGVTKEQLRKIKRLPINTIGMITETKEGIAIVEDGATASQLITAGRQFWHGGKLYSADVDIAEGAAIVTTGEGKNASLMPSITDQLPGTDAEKANNTVITKNIETGTTYSRAYAVGEHFMNNGVFRTVKSALQSGETITDSNSFVDTVDAILPFAGTGKSCDSIADVVAQYGSRVDVSLFIKCSNTLSGIITDSGINASGKIFVTYVGGGNYDWFGQFAIKGFAVGRFNSSTGYVNHSVISSP